MIATPTETAEELAALRAENIELRRIVAFMLANTSAGMSRGLIRSAQRPGFHPLMKTLEL